MGLNYVLNLSTIHNLLSGDFHFLWECLRVVFSMFWGNPSISGSLCQLREFIRRVQVDKEVKCFNVGDEFLLHVFQAHILAAVCTQLGIQSPADEIKDTGDTLEWLEAKAETLVESILFPQHTNDPVFDRHSSFIHTAFLYSDLRNAIKWEDGPHIVRHWKWWLPMFLGTGKKHYAKEAALLTCKLNADFPRHIAYIAINNRTVNMSGKPGHGKPMDQLMEHYNL